MKKSIFKILIAFIFGVITLVTTFSITNMQVSAQELGAGIDGVGAKSYIVIDGNGNTLVENNSKDRREVASICKLMTTLITLEKIDNGSISLDDKMIASDHACSAEGSQAFLDSGCEYSVAELLKSVIVASANDSAIVLAENIAGSEQNFVTLMNNKAKEIGMENTLYANSTGLSDGNLQYSTAEDTAKILNIVSNFETYKKDSKIWMDTLTHPSGRKTELVNTNRLIRYYSPCITGKTGFTDEAGYCLSSSALKDDLKTTCVILGCKSPSDRFTGSVNLYNYVYANFKNEKVIEKSKDVENNIFIVNGKQRDIKLEFATDYYLTKNRNDSSDYSIVYNLPNSLKAPINKGDVLGTADIYLNDSIVGSVDIVSSEDIEKQGFKDITYKIIDEFGFIN